MNCSGIKQLYKHRKPWQPAFASPNGACECRLFLWPVDWGDMMRTVAFLILALAVIGLADSVYLTLVHFGVANIEPRMAASACQFKAGSCETVAQSNSATTIGIPNAIFGALYFAFLAGAALVRVVTAKWLFPHLMLSIMVLALAFSGYMVYYLLYVQGVPCGFCLTAHAINLATFFMFAASSRRIRPRTGFEGAAKLGAVAGLA